MKKNIIMPIHKQSNWKFYYQHEKAPTYCGLLTQKSNVEQHWKKVTCTSCLKLKGIKTNVLPQFNTNNEQIKAAITDLTAQLALPPHDRDWNVICNVRNKLCKLMG